LVFAKQKPPAGELVFDHAGHFVADLEAAGKVLEALGFFATPVSHHIANGQPGGTANRCVMFEQGYLEILAPTLDTTNGRRVRHYMAAYDGIHLLSYGTPAAAEDRARLAAHGFNPDPLVELRRKLDSGEEVGFRVVYVPEDKMPECRAQYCEHLTPEVTWKDHWQKHGNGALALEDAYIVADDPAAVAARWAEFSGLLPFKDGKLVQLRTARGNLFFGTREVLGKFIDGVPAAPGVAALALRFKDPEAFAKRAKAMDLKVTKRGERHCVSLPPALGGAWLF
jgi:hypothetical protein